MDEKKAYQWAERALRNCNGEQHKREQCADLVATAIMRAHEQGKHIVAGSRIYDRCAECGKWVQINKRIFGSLHVCTEQKEGGSDVKNTSNDGQNTSSR